MPHQHQKPSKLIRIGTRGSRLALWQAREVVRLIHKFDPSIKVEEVIIKTSGDKFLGRLSESDIYVGKGLFVKEIEEALLSKKIDIAVHSLKDIPAELQKDLQITAYLKREDPYDIFISKRYRSINNMPKKAILGTSSPRRMAQVLSLRPDLRVLPLRGNIETRLKKVGKGECDATILATAGLKRLSLLKKLKKWKVNHLKRFIPAIGQGIICVESRILDKDLNFFLRSALNHMETEKAATAERTFLRTIGGDCHTPIAAHAVVKGGKLNLLGFIASPSGKKILKRTTGGTDPFRMGEELGKKFIELGARKILNGNHVLFTGLPETLQSLKEKFLNEGARIVELPLIKICGPSDNYKGLDTAIRRINRYDWLVFTSKNAVSHFLSRMDPLNCLNGLNCMHPLNCLNGLNHLRISSVGSSTAEALKVHNLKVDIIAREQSAEGLAREFAKLKLKDKRVLFPRSKQGRELLVDELRRHGAIVDVVETYQTLPADIDVKKYKIIFKMDPLDVIIFASPSAVKAYKTFFGKEFIKKSTKIMCIGDSTRLATRKAGLLA